MAGPILLVIMDTYQKNLFNQRLQINSMLKQAGFVYLWLLTSHQMFKINRCFEYFNYSSGCRS